MPSWFGYRQELTSDFKVAAFFLFGSVDKIKKILSAVESRGEGCQGTSFVTT
jgi:hypothetical protein